MSRAVTMSRIRKDLSLAQKLDILDKIKLQPPGCSTRRLSEILGVSKSTIARIQLQEQFLREQALSQVTTRKRKREGKDADVDEALTQWFTLATSRGVQVSGPILKAKSEDLARKLGNDEFKATDGWLSRWKVRHDIKFKRSHGEKASANSEYADEWKYTKLPQILAKFSLDDIYNADETGLYYRATPDGSLCFKHESIAGSKKGMDRITILCCVNASGTDKKKLLVIGKSKKPRCFQKIALQKLPVEYHANKNAWMTSAIFTDWLQRWDSELNKTKKAICLVLDNCTAHPNISLKNIKLEFLPPNTTSLIQPLDMGVIQNLKVKYRATLVNYILDKIEDNLLESKSTAIDISKKINILQAIQFISDSWRDVSSQTIKNCFRKCDFSEESYNIDQQLEPNSEENDNVRVLNNVEFEQLDSNVQCYDQNEYVDDVIIQSIQDQYNSDEDTDEEPDPPIRLQEAKKSLETLRLFFLQQGNEESPISALDTCSDYIRQQTLKCKKQSNIHNFFK